MKSLRYVVAGMLLGMWGCQSGVGVVSYERSTTPVVAEATEDGEYALYGTASMDPKVSYYLHKGDPLGFKSGKTGEIIAVAGKAEISEPDGGFVWRRREPQATVTTNASGNSTSNSASGH